MWKPCIQDMGFPLSRRGEDILLQRTRSSSTPITKGIYTLIFQSEGCRLSIGALGNRHFSPGWYGYIGSAHGSGGFARVRRHVTLTVRCNRNPHWHIDYLLMDSRFHLQSAICGCTTEDKECYLAKSFSTDAVKDFGCSDCSCTSHLFFWENDPMEEIISAFRVLGITPVIKTIKNHG